MDLTDLLLGRRLANRESGARKLGTLEAVPAMGLDALGSCAYGPEAALTVLAPLGAAGLADAAWIMAVVAGLLLILFLSYWQTLGAYPGNGGAYLVARENLGVHGSLLAAAALMIDYVLNVAVGISAGMGVVVSVVPALHPHLLLLCLGTLGLITVVNLRGTLESGRLFAIPTYLFVASFALILARGLLDSFATAGHPHPQVSPLPLQHGAAVLGPWLLLRAFASGCTAMTGVEAVSNGMSAFREPTVRFGRRTLSAIVLILGLLLLGIGYLSRAYAITAADQTQPGYRSVLAQLAAAVLGQGVCYYIAVGALLCVLVLSANTSFVGFPRLCRTVAGDGYLPKSFAIAGHRLVFSVGILYLSALAALLLIGFGGITDRLIPLFAIGAFLTFTLSQTGMLVRWYRQRAAQREHEGAGSAATMQFWANAVGAAATALATIVIVLAKFAAGAWITLLVIPAVILLLRSIHSYYGRLARQVSDPQPLQIGDTRAPIVLVATQEWNKLTDRALCFALSLSPDVLAVHLTDLSGPQTADSGRSLRERWQRDVVAPAVAAGLPPPRLELLQAQYRCAHEPILDLVRHLEARSGGRRIAVLIPEIIKQHWYQHLLHTRRARRLRAALLSSGARVTVISVPWSLESPLEPRARAPSPRSGAGAPRPRERPPSSNATSPATAHRSAE